MSLWTLVIYISPYFFLCFICTLLIEEAKLWSHILRSVHCLSQHQWCTLPSSKSLRTWISCQFSMLWLLVKFPLPYILHGDRKELILISLMSSRMWCTARRGQKGPEGHCRSKELIFLFKVYFSSGLWCSIQFFPPAPTRTCTLLQRLKHSGHSESHNTPTSAGFRAECKPQDAYELTVFHEYHSIQSS